MQVKQFGTSIVTFGFLFEKSLLKMLQREIELWCSHQETWSTFPKAAATVAPLHDQAVPITW